jgi:transposase-like protein
MKKAYTPRFIAQVVLELLKETKTISQLAAEYVVHPNVVRAWRDQAVKELPAVFEKRDSLIDAHPRQATGGTLRPDWSPDHPCHLSEKRLPS